MKIAITARDFYGSAVEMLQAAGHTIVDHNQAGMGSGTSIDAVIAAVGDADVAIAGLEPYNEAVFAACPNLKLISRRGIGYDSVDVNACRDHGVTLARTVGAVEGSVAEHVLASILYFARRVDLQNASMHRGEWKRTQTPGAKTRRLGLIGFGGIGKEVAKRALPFGMEVSYNCRHPRKEWAAEYGVSYKELDQLLCESDYIAACVPLTESTKNMFDAAMFARMKPGCIFINIARGGIMDAEALRAALDSGHLGGAAVDVFNSEPCTDSPLIGCPTALLTPHTAPFTTENFDSMNVIAARNVLDWIEGKLDAGMCV